MTDTIRKQVFLKAIMDSATNWSEFSKEREGFLPKLAQEYRVKVAAILGTIDTLNLSTGGTCREPCYFNSDMTSEAPTPIIQ